jgi:UDP-N-acetylglucosamine 1-carboxyvinyltransferase
MGANIKSWDKKAVIIGNTQLKGRKVKATDLRAGASLLVAGMIANGITEVDNIEHLLRGYENLVHKLNTVGADIKLIDE